MGNRMLWTSHGLKVMGLKVHSLNYDPLHFVQRTEVLLGQSIRLAIGLRNDAVRLDPSFHE